LCAFEGREQLRREFEPPLVQQRRAAGDDGVPLDDAFDAETVAVAERLDGGKPRVLRRGLSDRARDRMLGGMLERADQMKCVSDDRLAGRSRVVWNSPPNDRRART
jgi:hypothetical protein